MSGTGVRTLANQITYGNEGARFLQTLMYKLNSDVLALQNHVHDEECEYTL